MPGLILETLYIVIHSTCACRTALAGAIYYWNHGADGRDFCVEDSKYNLTVT